MPKPVYEEGDIKVLWNQAVHTDREVTANRPDSSLVFSLEGRAWQEPEPSHVTGTTLAHCILGKFLGVVCHCFPPGQNIIIKK